MNDSRAIGLPDPAHSGETDPAPHGVTAWSPSGETIVAVATPPGRGGIGIVRISGSDARVVAAQLVRAPGHLPPRQAQMAAVLDDEGRRVDDALVTFFPAPRSYTGDDVVEIAAHGSPVVLELLLRRALQQGSRLARPGEFTERAFLSGRLDLTQAEAVRDLIEAQTLFQVRVAAQQLGGALSQRVAPVKEQLIALITSLEAGIDFAEDDVDVVPYPEIAARTRLLESALAPLAASFAEGRFVRSGVTLAIVGRPNAGKSSLFNRLVERERAIVTAQPGTTRDLVTETVSLGGLPVQLVDTAGLRETADEVEAMGIARTYTAIADADLVLLVLDAGAAVRGGALELNQQEAALREGLTGRRALVVLNKVDLLGERTPSGWPSSVPLAAVSAATGFGIDSLREAIVTLLHGPGGEASEGLLTNVRHFEAIGGCMDALRAAANATAARIPHEMVLLDLYAALRHLDALTGETTADDILNRIFSTFCIGK